MLKTSIKQYLWLGWSQSVLSAACSAELALTWMGIMSHKYPLQEILSACWSFDPGERPSFTVLMDMLEKLPKLNRRLSHPGHFWKSAE